jgi:hypothetical protein
MLFFQLNNPLPPLIIFEGLIRRYCYSFLRMVLSRQRLIRNFLDRFIDVPRHHNPPRQSIRKSKRCVSKTKKNVQCRKRTAHSEKCWIHLAANDNLRIYRYFYR